MARSSLPVAKPRILVMDDSEIALYATSVALEDQGFDVRVAQSLGAFNVILKTWSPNIVLTDVNMPGMNGAELCRWIKVRIDTQSVPVVLFSDLPEPELAELAEESGADAFVTKAAGLQSVSKKLSALFEEIVW
jgi:CheY-like chemotaxis protein